MAKKRRSHNKRYSNLYVKRRLLRLEIDIFDIISNGLMNHLGKKKILTQVKQQITSLAVQIDLDQVEVNHLWLYAYSEYDKISKKTFSIMRKLDRNQTLNDEQKTDLRKAAIYSSIRANINRNDLIKKANEITYEYEYRNKHDEVYEEGGLLDSATSPFFLCSSHPKPAKDHADWEGRMYYDEDWESKGEYSEDDKDRIRAYIHNRKLRSVQWVCGAPVYLVTRRNCKHYLVNLPIDEVMHSSPKALLKKHKLYIKEDEPVSEAVRAYREYYSRLKVEEALNAFISNPQLKKDIHRDKILVDKWKSLM